ncbi:MAG: hypothetical protein ACREOM_08660 [Candidatus Dormibacteraceae bacterium]
MERGHQSSRFKALIAFAAFAITALAAAIPMAGAAYALPSGERVHGNVAVEPAYNDADGSILYIQTPNHLAPLGPTNVIQNVNPHAVAPLYLIVYPLAIATFNCTGVPGNCPDHAGAIAGLAVSMQPSVYGSDPRLVPGHDHLIAGHHAGDFNVAWRVYVELFTSPAAVTHVTTLAELDSAKTSGAIQEVDTGIVFLCSIVSEAAYLAGMPVA